MKKTTANLLTIVGGIWTGLIGILLLGSFLNLGSEDGGAALVTPLIWMSGLLLVGVAMFCFGLRMMRRR